MTNSWFSAKTLKKIVNNPYLNFSAAFVFFLSGLFQAWKTIEDDFINMDFGVHHGAIVFGLFHMLKAFSYVYESLDYYDKGIEPEE